MTKIHCFTRNTIPPTFENDIQYFELFSKDYSKRISIGRSIPSQLRKFGIVPSIPALDFATFAISVVAADKSVPRSSSSDGWTRMIELSIPMCDSETWSAKSDRIEKILRYLTGDFWKLNFFSIESPLSTSKKPPTVRNNDCVCLLSGGVDSLVGAIDLVSDGFSPLFVSQIVRGDAAHQREFAETLNMSNQFQWSIGKLPRSEGSTRARSLAFFTFAVLSTCSLHIGKEKVKIIVPENGFISLNIPLNANRIGSLSTKTTHPIFISMLQELWDAIGLEAELVLPYKYKTKGEILKECKDKDILSKLVFVSNSCGKYQRHNLQQCGVCVPCLVRRAAFLEAGMQDKTEKGYVYENLRISDSQDLVAVALSVKQLELEGVDRFVKSGLAFATGEERQKLLEVVSRGLIELKNLLRGYSFP
jgi:hypothetical protein